MYELDGTRRPNDLRTWPCAQHVFGALFVVLGLALNAPAAFAPSGSFPSLDLITLTSDRVELVRVVPPQDTAHSSLLYSGRIVHYQVVRHFIGSGPSPGSITVYVLSQESVPVEGDTLLVFWQLVRRTDFGDGTRYLTVLNLTNPERDEMPALTSDFRVQHNSDSVLAIVVLRTAMVRARCPLGDERCLSLADFVEGRGCVERWMPDDSEAAEVNPFSANVLASPADTTMLPSCRTRVARHLRAIRAEGIPAVRRAATLALQSLDGEPLR